MHVTKMCPRLSEFDPLPVKSVIISRVRPNMSSAAGPSTESSSMNVAFKTFCLENGITDLDPEDEIFRYDPEESRRINREQPW